METLIKQEKEIINLNNFYFFKIIKSVNHLPNDLVDIRKIKIREIWKKGNLLLKVDFKCIERKQYKKILKTLLRIERIRKKKIGMVEDSKILIGYLVNYDENNNDHYNFITGMNAIFYPTRKERYNYIYDTVCDYLDSFFYGKNLCDFKDNKCGEKRNTNSCIGCCHHYKNKLLGPLISHNLVPCEYLKEDYTCKAHCIACKLFTCDYLEKKGIKFRIKDILLLDTFFNPIQKYFIKCMVFTPKEKILKRLLRT